MSKDIQRALALVEERLLEEKEHDVPGVARSLLTLFHHHLQASQASPLPL